MTPKLAEHIHVTSGGGLVIDGEEFPWHYSEAGASVAVRRDDLPGVTLTIVAERVTVNHEVNHDIDGRARTDCPRERRARMKPVLRAWLSIQRLRIAHRLFPDLFVKNWTPNTIAQTLQNEELRLKSEALRPRARGVRRQAVDVSARDAPQRPCAARRRAQGRTRARA